MDTKGPMTRGKPCPRDQSSAGASRELWGRALSESFLSLACAQDRETGWSPSEEDVYTHHLPLTLGPLAFASPTCSTFSGAPSFGRLSGDLGQREALTEGEVLHKGGARHTSLTRPQATSPSGLSPSPEASRTCHLAQLLLQATTFLQVSPGQGGTRQCLCAAAKLPARLISR